jgi:PAS domain S-box-containing protein
MHDEPACKNRRVLVIDDNRSIHDDFRKILLPASAMATALNATEAAVFGLSMDALQQTRFEMGSAYQGQEGVLLVKKALEAGLPYAMAFVDVRMPPGWDGVETTKRIWEIDSNLQIVLCTAYSDYSWREMFEKLGHRDGLLILKKPFDAVEAFQLAHTLTEKWWLHQQFRLRMEELESRVGDRTRQLQQTNQALQMEVAEHQRAEETLRLLGSAVEQSKESIVITDAEVNLPGPRILFVNPAFTKMTGYTAKEAIGQTPRILQGRRTDKTVLNRLRHNLEQGEAFEGETINYRKDGMEFNLEWQIAPIRDALGKTTHFVAIQRDITARKMAEQALHRLRNQHALILNSIGEGVHGLDVDGNIIFENPVSAAMLGYEIADLIGRPAHTTMHHSRPDGASYPQIDCPIYSTLRDGQIRHVRNEVFWRKDGTSFPVEYTSAPLHDEDGRITGVTVVFTNVTARKRFEAQLFQSQKLETVGKLSGGIAHEFNSILTAIIGQSELLLGDLPTGSPLTKNAIEISQAAGRAATLTRQLLAYGRKQILQPETLDLNRVLAGMQGMFRHLMGSDVDTQIVPGLGLQAVQADAGQIEQVIMNMAINAREAMPKGGKLTLETANVSFDQESVGRYPELKAGDYVMLAITDTGAGMSEEVKARVFEPFFTTKDIGEGTGLGLSTCYGIVKQSGGHISVYSEVGRGATFKIYLPQVQQQAQMAIPRLDSKELPRGTETILLVEDDPALREMAGTLLKRLGYTVWAAANGIEALSLKQQRNVGHIDLLFTDVVMPHMSGKELADRVQSLYPHTKILFTSAYTESAIVHQGVLNKGVALLQKPFTPSALARKLREILDQPRAPKPDGEHQTFGDTTIPAGATTVEH